MKAPGTTTDPTTATPAEYGLANAIQHPRTVYLREQRRSPAGPVAGAAFDHADAARRTVRDCDHRLVRYRAALEAGADPALGTAWIAKTKLNEPPLLEGLPDTPTHEGSSTRHSGWN